MREWIDRRFHGVWEPSGYLLTPVLIALIVVAAKLAADEWLLDGRPDPGWPGAAAQVLGALIIAAVLEGGLFQARNRWPATPWWRKWILTEILWYWPALALVVSVIYAARHQRFGPVPDAFVTGAIAALLVTVGNMAALNAWDQRRSDWGS